MSTWRKSHAWHAVRWNSEQPPKVSRKVYTIRWLNHLWWICLHLSVLHIYFRHEICKVRDVEIWSIDFMKLWAFMTCCFSRTRIEVNQWRHFEDLDGDGCKCIVVLTYWNENSWSSLQVFFLCIPIFKSIPIIGKRVSQLFPWAAKQGHLELPEELPAGMPPTPLKVGCDRGAPKRSESTSYWRPVCVFC